MILDFNSNNKLKGKNMDGQINWVIKVNADLKRKVKSCCALNDEKISDFVARVLIAYLEREECDGCRQNEQIGG